MIRGTRTCCWHAIGNTSSTQTGQQRRTCARTTNTLMIQCRRVSYQVRTVRGTSTWYWHETLAILCITRAAFGHSSSIALAVYATPGIYNVYLVYGISKWYTYIPGGHLQSAAASGVLPRVQLDVQVSLSGYQNIGMWCKHIPCERSFCLNPFGTAVPFLGQNTDGTRAICPEFGIAVLKGCNRFRHSCSGINFLANSVGGSVAFTSSPSYYAG